MSSDNVYPTIDSMSIDEIISYLRSDRKCLIYLESICSCKYPIARNLPSDNGEKICQKCARMIIGEKKK